MTLRKIKQWGFRIGIETATDNGLPPEVTQDNFDRNVEIEWCYVENQFASSNWWNHTALPKIFKNREKQEDKDRAFDALITSAFDGFKKRMREMINAQSPVTAEV